ncbi:hypothetical protein BM477_06445 [Boudabousia marimammalium]|uniref:Type II secretion system protein GspF domain-containing protein n=2 Tax=Boudabousia marimammalium TaxID=156892 RepID=A0A1Q5PM17_9ACTO|nr:hypothetical protein BM477_06445 [Boudabousia marimammalium]
MLELAYGAIVGSLAGVGLVLAWYAWASRRVTLSRRLSPVIAKTSETTSDTPQFAQLFTDPFRRVFDWFLYSVGSTNQSVMVRLGHAAMAGGVQRIRSYQMLGAGLAFAGTTVLAVLLILVRGIPILLAIVLIIVITAVGVILPDQLLTMKARSRQQALSSSVSDAAELVSLSVSAGEGIVEALARVSEVLTGPLAVELAAVVAEINAGTQVAVALRNLRDRNDSAPLSRLVDALLIALERGTPLAGMLRAQAADAREAARRQLIEEGGRKEIAMLIPVVFLILPITVLFALYPGLMSLRINF